MSAIPRSPVTVIVCFLWWEPCSSRLLAAVEFIIQYPWPQPLCSAFSLQDNFISEFQVYLKQDHCLLLLLKSHQPGRSLTLLCNATYGPFKGRHTKTQTHLIFSSEASARGRKCRNFTDKRGCGPLCTQGKPLWVSLGSVFAKTCLKITAAYCCSPCRRASPWSAWGSSCPTRTWTLTASSAGPSKTVRPGSVDYLQAFPGGWTCTSLISPSCERPTPPRGPGSRAPASTPFWANQQTKEVGDSADATPVAVLPQAGHFTALSLTFPIWAMERTVPFFFLCLVDLLFCSLLIYPFPVDPWAGISRHSIRNIHSTF